MDETLKSYSNPSMSGETTFENAKIGDRVFSMMHGVKSEEDKTNGYICDFFNNKKEVCFCLDNTENKSWFKINGNFLFENKLHGQVLFWSKPEFVVPTRPKRMVKKKGFVGVDVSGPTNGFSVVGAVARTTWVYDTVEALIKARGCTDYKVAEIIYEVEE